MKLHNRDEYTWPDPCATSGGVRMNWRRYALIAPTWSTRTRKLPSGNLDRPTPHEGILPFTAGRRSKVVLVIEEVGGGDELDVALLDVVEQLGELLGGHVRIRIVVDLGLRNDAVGEADRELVVLCGDVDHRGEPLQGVHVDP